MIRAYLVTQEGKQPKLILNSPHCFPHTCAAYLGWPAALGRALSDTLTIL